MKGHILKQMRFNYTPNHTDDGDFAQRLKNTFPDSIKIIPDLFVFGNYFESGRYTNDQWKIKSTWELPEYV
jgi:hypothetical protein